MGDPNFPLLCYDTRHLSCPLDENWYRRAREAVRYDKTWERLAKQRSKWKYDESDCQCIGVGYDAHDPRNECRCCGKCVADEPAIIERSATSEDKGFCLPCAMALENCSIEDVAALFN